MLELGLEAFSGVGRVFKAKANSQKPREQTDLNRRQTIATASQCSRSDSVISCLKSAIPHQAYHRRVGSGSCGCAGKCTLETNRCTSPCAGDVTSSAEDKVACDRLPREAVCSGQGKSSHFQFSSLFYIKLLNLHVQVQVSLEFGISSKSFR